MKKTYTEEEYRSLAEVAGGEPKPHSKHPISREEYERRKKAKAEGREQSGRALMITSIVSAVILVLCLAVTGISVAIKKSKAKKGRIVYVNQTAICNLSLYERTLPSDRSIHCRVPPAKR